MLYLISTCLLDGQVETFRAIEGNVYDKETGLPIENVSISIIDNDIKIQTGKYGHFHFINLKKGFYYLEFFKLGYLKERRLIELDKSDLRNVTIYLIPISFQTPIIYVTEKAFRNKFDEFHDFTGTLDNNELVRELSRTIATTLSNEVGVTVSSMGPAPARPVIRGLGGNRITIAEDGLNSIDLSGYSNDHAVAIDPATVKKIEIIRGPKTLTHSSTSTGGVVNIAKDEIPLSMNEKTEASALVYGETANLGYNGTLNLKFPINQFMLTGGASLRQTDNLYTPVGIIDKTSIKNHYLSFGSGYVQDDYSIGIGINEFSTDYGIPGGFIGAHPKGVSISLIKRLWQSKAIFHFKQPLLDVVSIDFGRTFYKHTEFESNGSIGAQYLLTNIAGRLNVSHKSSEIFREGNLGLTANYKKMKFGGFVFAPNNESNNVALYFYESIKLGKHYLEFSARYEHDNIIPAFTDSTKIGWIRERSFNNISASISVMHEITSLIYAGVNFSQTTRAPSSEELFSMGPHLASYSFEVGNPDLKSELGWSTEIFSYAKFDYLTLSATGFITYMDNYIISQNTGKINVAQILPIYAFSNVKALFYGYEMSLKFQLAQSLHMTGIISYTHAENFDTKLPLPFIPPLKTNVSLFYSPLRELSLYLRTDFAGSQNRLGEFEEATKGYIIFNSGITYNLFWANLLHNLSISIENIFNQEYRNHLSKIKSIFPETGRNLRLAYKLNL